MSKHVHQMVSMHVDFKTSGVPEYSFKRSVLNLFFFFFCCCWINKILSVFSSSQNSAKLHHRAGSTQFPKACATSSKPAANLLKAWKGRWSFCLNSIHEMWCKNSCPNLCRLNMKGFVFTTVYGQFSVVNLDIHFIWIFISERAQHTVTVTEN